MPGIETWAPPSRAAEWMLPERRAVLFDLDDTLYPAGRFVSSGFAVVARYLEQTHRLDAEAVHATLVAASKGLARGRELQQCVRKFGLHESIVGELIALIRDHEPCLAIPRTTAAVLRALRPEWRLGVVTNGVRVVQARKVAALGLERLVDCVVYAHEHGSGAGKPDREPFLDALRRLDVPAHHAVFVGDDDYCDIFGASRVGMQTVLTAAWNMRPRGRPVRANMVVVSLKDVPRIAELLVATSWKRHIA